MSFLEYASREADRRTDRHTHKEEAKEQRYQSAAINPVVQIIRLGTFLLATSSLFHSVAMDVPLSRTRHLYLSSNYCCTTVMDPPSVCTCNNRRHRFKTTNKEDRGPGFWLFDSTEITVETLILHWSKCNVLLMSAYTVLHQNVTSIQARINAGIAFSFHHFPIN